MRTRRQTALPAWIYAIALSLALGWSITAAAETLTLGVVPQFDARRIQTIWQPLIDALEVQSGIQFKLIGSPSIPEFEKQLEAGEFDFAYMNPYHLLKAHEVQGYQPLLRDIGRSLYGIVVVSKSSLVDDVQELDGMAIAFPAPNALGASLIPRTEFGETYKINIKPRYVHSHDSVYLNVVTGQTVAGGGVMKTLQAQPAYIRDSLKVIYKTPEVAPHPVAAHPRTGQATQDKVRKAFLTLGYTQEGKEILARIPMKKIGRAVLEDYDSLKEMGLNRYVVQ